MAPHLRAPRGLNYPRHPSHYEIWRRWELQITSVSAPNQILNWWRTQRAVWWTKFATHRFLSDAAEGVIVAYDSQARDVPATYWQSDVDFDPQRGDLYCRHDGRLPLRRSLRFHAADDVPAAAAARAARNLGDVKAAILEAMAEHADDLAGLPISERVAIIADLLPFPAATVRTVVYRACAFSRSAPAR
jgi:hypothetical protein